MLCTAGWGEGKGVGGRWVWMKAGGTIYHSVSPLSSQNPRLFISSQRAVITTGKQSGPFQHLYFTLNPPFAEVWTFPLQPSTQQAACLLTLAVAARQEPAHPPTEMQINIWIDKKQTRWNVQTIWFDITRMHTHTHTHDPPPPSFLQWEHCLSLFLSICGAVNRRRWKWATNHSNLEWGHAALLYSQILSRNSAQCVTILFPVGILLSFSSQNVPGRNFFAVSFLYWSLEHLNSGCLSQLFPFFFLEMCFQQKAHCNEMRIYISSTVENWNKSKKSVWIKVSHSVCNRHL